MGSSVATGPCGPLTGLLFVGCVTVYKWTGQTDRRVGGTIYIDMYIYWDIDWTIDWVDGPVGSC